MRPIDFTTTIDAPRERVFEYLSDIANYPEFADHFLKEFRLERLESRGVGAAARFRIESSLARLPLMKPLATLWAEAVITGVERPYRITLEGTAGRFGRMGLRAEFRLTRHDHEMTRLDFTFATEPATTADRLREALGARAWTTAQGRRALRRLKFVLEEGEPSTRAVRVAAG